MQIHWGSRPARALVLVLAVAGPLAWNVINLAAIRRHEQAFALSRGVPQGQLRENGGSTLAGVTIWSIDNEYYLSQAENARLGRGFGYGYELNAEKNSYSAPAGPGAFVRRMPGYSLWYGAWRALADLPTALLLLRTAQWLLAIAAVLMLADTLRAIGVAPVVRWWTTAAFAVVPWTSGWASYTLTEALTPVLVVACVWQSARAYTAYDPRRRLGHYASALVLLSLTVLTRPLLGLCALPLGLLLLRELGTRRMAWRQLVIVLIAPAVLYGSWLIWARQQTGEWTLVERTLHPSNPDRMRPPFIGMGELLKASGGWINWRTNRVFNEQYTPLLSAAWSGDTSGRYRAEMIRSLPPILKSSIDSLRLDAALRAYQLALAKRKDEYAAYRNMGSSYSADELAVADSFHVMAADFKRQYPIYSAVAVPLQYLYIAVVHSHTGHLFVLHDRHQTWVKAAKALLLGLHVSLFALFGLAVVLALAGRRWVWLACSAAPLLALIFLTLFFREYEQRYMMPLLPLVWIQVALLLDLLRQRMSGKPAVA